MPEEQPPRDPLALLVGTGDAILDPLRAALERHPELAVLADSASDLALGLEERRRRFEGLEELDVDALVRELAVQPGFPGVGLTEEAAADALAAARPRDLAEALRAAYLARAAREGATRVALVGPTELEGLPRLTRLFEESRVVHVLGDGRTAADSGPRDSAGVEEDLVEAALRWRRHVMADRRTGAELGPDRYLEVRQERLIEDPEPVLREVCEFLGLGWEPGLVSAPGEGARVGSAASARRARVFELVAGDLLRELGYEPAPAPPPGAEEPDRGGREERERVVRHLLGEAERLHRRFDVLKRRKSGAQRRLVKARRKRRIAEERLAAAKRSASSKEG